MDQCLQTKKSNCKNCYKCIRHCPVKALRMTDGQAHIIREECILCGECFVVCPQNAKQIRDDSKRATELISTGKVIASLAPSYAARYPGCSLNDIKDALSKLGFSDVEETAVGATIVKKEYERIIAENEQSVIISTCCPSINALVEKHFKNAVPYLAKTVSPMAAHGLNIKSRNPETKVIFIGPCISKKAEAEQYPEVIDLVLTFDELDGILSEKGICPVPGNSSESEKHRTNLFPTSGGILKSMDRLPGFDYIVVDGTDNCINALKSIESGNISNCFIEMSACSGSCISGPIMKKQGRNPVFDKLSVMKNADAADYSVDMPKHNEIYKNFRYNGSVITMPGSAAIDEILRKMGKTSKEKELNCGSCGYDTCHEKAVAVLRGKADLTMCLPYLKEKAESFSDTIVNNTPNGIIVLDEQLNVQMINKAAKKILNLPPSADVLNSPVVRILDPTDYLLASNDRKNVYDNRKYLAEYGKYVEETIICDREYHIIMIMIKDVTGEENAKSRKELQSKAAISITDKVIEKQMRIVQEIASLLGETTAETKIALTKLKETLSDE